jgi:hypothetical protein
VQKITGFRGGVKKSQLMIFPCNFIRLNGPLAVGESPGWAGNPLLLEFVISGFIRKFTDAQGDTKAGTNARYGPL